MNLKADIEMETYIHLAPVHREYLNRRGLDMQKLAAASVPIGEFKRVLSCKEFKKTDSVLNIQGEGWVLFPSLRIIPEIVLHERKISRPPQ